jgi:twitching motility two-component system response regulator PilG
MRRRTDRYAMDVTVELFASGESRRVGVADVSRTGMFLRVSPPLPVGEPIHVAMFFEGRQLATPATVVHGLADDDARALGRRPGIGIAFDRPTRHADTMFLRAVEQLLARRERETTSAAAPNLHVVIADPSTRMLERLSTELAAAGCSVATATNGLEAIGACMREIPDVIVVDRALPVFDGFQVIRELAQRSELRDVPVIVMSQDANDLDKAFDRGAKDVLHKPFGAVELVSRCCRVARVARDHERVALRGDLAEVGLPAILVMLEQERKSGRLELTGDDAAWIELSNGAIVGAGPAHGTDLRAIVFALLDRRAGASEPPGEFRFIATPPVRRSIAMPVTYLLMEHARITDERDARRAHRATA